MDRITASDEVLKSRFSLHVDAAKADPLTLKRAVESTIAAGAGVSVEHHVARTKVLVLIPNASGVVALKDAAPTGFAVYQPKIGTLTCIHASMDDVAAALEEVLNIPIVNGTNLPGRISLTMKMPPGDLLAAREALKQQLGASLIESERSIETLTLAPVVVNP